MKHRIMVFLLLFILAGCGPEEVVVPTESPEDEPSDGYTLLTPAVPEGSVFIDACTHLVSYPEGLTVRSPGDLFTSDNEERFSVYIKTRRRFEDEVDLSHQEVAEGIFVAHIRRRSGNETEVETVDVTNYLSQPLVGYMAETVKDGMHYRVMVVVQPESLLMDMVSDDVVYEIYGQAPEADWDVWGPQIDMIYETFHPMMCGGV